MSKNQTKNRDRNSHAALHEAEDDEEPSVTEFAPDASDRQEPMDREAQAPRPARPAKPGGGGLKIYKPTQGYYVRMGTAIGAVILIVAGGIFLFNDVAGRFLDTTKNPSLLYVQYGMAVAFMLAGGVLLYWIVGLNRKANDFFIATEGEMKKVSWSTRAEIIRSTKVVIVTVVLMAILLFVVDILFMEFFRAIGVLKGGPQFWELFGETKK